MKMDIVAGSGNDEFYTPMYAIHPLLKYIPAGSVIWCPFDGPKSLYLKAFADSGCRVIASHIASGVDFFTCDPPECDFIVSNPPYSTKAAVLQRLFDIGTPFAMLVGVVGLFESEKRFEMFARNDFEIMYLSKRIAYFKDYDEERPSLNPPFSSVYLCRGVLPRQIVFERIVKTKKLRT